MSTGPAWLAVTQSTSTTVGVLIALYIAAWREPRKARAEHAESERKADTDNRRHDEQMTTLLRAENERIAAQARKVVPAVTSTSVLGKGVHVVRVVNHSAAPITDLKVSVVALDLDGADVENGCESVNDKLDAGTAFSKIVSEVMTAAMDRMPGGMAGLS